MKQYNIKVNGKCFTVEVEEVPCGKASAPVAKIVSAAAVKPVDTASAPAASAAGNDVTSPLPGVILSVKVKQGDKVSAGQTVAVLEAMKMENAIEAETAGTVTAVYVQNGESVLEGAKIVTIE
ncbi:MAG: biotin/lipoyl-binding protein [Bacteroidales bacterium]|nr:biotin/lipoyl-binding protein [Bacteroidales bacterium]